MDDQKLPEPQLSEYVNAVMFTGRNQAGQNFAHGAIRCFLEQSYRDRHLIIMNQDPRYLYMEDDYPGITEVQVSPTLTRPQLWRLANAYAHKGWLMNWADDCWHHPHRMVFQMAHRREMNHCNLLRSMLTVDLVNNTVGVDEHPHGHVDTMLFPTGLLDTGVPDLDDEDRLFNTYFAPRQQYTVTENEHDTWPGSALCARIIYENTDLTQEQRAAIVERMNLQAVTEDHSVLLQEIMPDFYRIDVGVKELD
jgi:hypothetical protein